MDNILKPESQKGESLPTSEETLRKNESLGFVEREPLPPQLEQKEAGELQGDHATSGVERGESSEVIDFSTEKEATISEEEDEKKGSVDNNFSLAAKKVIKNYKGKPFEEEEAHEDLQIKYLWQRFKKRLSKSKD